MQSRQEKAVDQVRSDTGLNVIRELGQLKTFSKNTPIFSPGDAATHLYLIAEGEVKRSRFTAEGRELTLDHLGPQSVFGEMEVLLGTPREIQASARSNVRAHALDRETLNALMASDHSFSLWLALFMGQRQSRMESRMETLLFKSANGRVAQVLADLARTHGERTEEGMLINYSITHQEIGNLIATTRETVSYAFMEFRQLGLISTRQRKTIVHDLSKLNEVALM